MSNSTSLLTPSEVAKKLKLNLLTIYKYIRSGNLGAMRFGRTYRISETDLDKFMRRHKI